MVMYNGRMVEKASAEDIFEEPLHPYTQGLLSAIPRITKERAPLSTIEGMVPNPTEYIEGCRFCPRCPKATERCRQQEPPVFEHGARQVRCWLCETETAKALLKQKQWEVTARKMRIAVQEPVQRIRKTKGCWSMPTM